MTGRHLDHPFRIDARGRTATTEADDHIRDMIYQVLFTSPGERVNRPEFGCGLLQMVFKPNSEALAAATELLLHGSLQEWLGDLIDVQSVNVASDEERLVVEVVYARRDTGERASNRFVAPVSGV